LAQLLQRGIRPLLDQLAQALVVALPKDRRMPAPMGIGLYINMLIY
jgi:hypothetical protein